MVKVPLKSGLPNAESIINQAYRSMEARQCHPAPRADFMTDWLAFQDAEREDRAKLQWGGAWPPKVGLEFPR